MVKMKRTGTAVSLYLPADVKYLHDLAKQDPNLVPSNIYADALRAVLGNVDPMHPLEIIRENQRKTISELEERLGLARNQLEMTEQRLPGEIAKKFYLENVLGKSEVKEMGQLRKILFFDISGGSSEITVTTNDGEAMIERYVNLIGKFEATKFGTENISIEKVGMKHRHPVEFTSNGSTYCVNSNNLDDVCQNVDLSSKSRSLIESPIANNLCDDLQYRCDKCMSQRQRDFTNSKLKPFWEVEALSPEQIIVNDSLINRKNNPLGTKQGLLARNKEILQDARKLALIQHFRDEWTSTFPEDAMALESLNEQRNHRPERDANDLIIPNWVGSNRWGRQRKMLLEVLKRKGGETFEVYTKNLDLYLQCNKKQTVFISERLQQWYATGCQWDEKVNLLNVHNVLQQPSVVTSMMGSPTQTTYVKTQREVLVNLVNDAKIIGYSLGQ
jgi:hypothetical protein